jgi:hypothetical protein
MLLNTNVCSIAHAGGVKDGGVGITLDTAYSAQTNA